MNRKDLLALLAKKNAALPEGRKLDPFGKTNAQIAAFVGVRLQTITGKGVSALQRGVSSVQRGVSASNSQKGVSSKSVRRSAAKHKEAVAAVATATQQLKAEGKPVNKTTVLQRLKKNGVKLGELIATEGTVYAAGMAAGAIAGPVGVALGGATTRAAILGAKKVHGEMVRIKAEAATAKKEVSHCEAAHRAIRQVASEGVTKVRRVMSTLKSGEFLTELKHELGGDFAAPVLEEAAHHFIEHHAEHLISAAAGGGAAAVVGGMIVSTTVKAIDHALAHYKPIKTAGHLIGSAISRNMGRS